jgi:hypothetical protein
MTGNFASVATDSVLAGSQTLGIEGGAAFLVLRAPGPCIELKCDGIVLTPCRPPACSSGGSYKYGTRTRPARLSSCVPGTETVFTYDDQPLVSAEAVRSYMKASLAFAGGAGSAS